MQAVRSSGHAVAEDEAMQIRTLAMSAFLVALAGCTTAPQRQANNTAGPPPSVMPADRQALYCAPPSDTATRLPPRPDQCSTGNMKTYTGEQLEQTGATQTGDALRYLDPEITIHH
jgi:hypothetical protein